MKKISCCYGCEERYEACHASCDKYKQERAEYDAEQEIIKSGRSLDVALNDYAVRKHDMLKEASKYMRRKR